jgi:hypothetical protein
VSAADLLAYLTGLGITLLPDRGGSFRVRSPKGAMTDELRRCISERRVELLLLMNACPECGGPLDRRQGCCWRCGWRQCECGRQTGSPFIATCLLCEFSADRRNEETPEAETTRPPGPTLELPHENVTT